ncbi:MAG: hypothetical protein K2K30_08145 [Alistipes sp.]|nr:hypothetical protein [Alistipes sp.]
MNRKLKLAAAALLGFSAACSSVKNAPSRSESEAPAPDTMQLEHPRVRVMYGVRVPGIAPAPLQDSVKIADEKPDPVAERPEEE